MEERVKAVEAQVKHLLESEVSEDRLCGYNALAGVIGVEVGHTFWKCIRDFNRENERGDLRVVKCTVDEIEVWDKGIRYEYSCWIGGFVIRVLRVGNEEAYADLSRGYEAALENYKERISAKRKQLKKEIAERVAVIENMEAYLEGLSPVPL
jgi:hypothetical protein